MPDQSPLDVADRLSRWRPYALLLSAAYFGLIRLVVPPDAAWGQHMARGPGWAMSAALMLLAFSPLAGSGWGHGVRALFNDDVSRHHSRIATAVGFSLAIVTALALFLLPVSATLAARAAIYLIVTPALSGALLTFAWLEWRVQRDG